MVPTTTYPSLVWVHAVGPQGREEETAAALGVLAAQTHDSHRVRSDRAPQMGPQAHTRPYRPFQNVTTVTRLWGKLSGYSPKTARNMAGRPSGKCRDIQASVGHFERITNLIRAVMGQAQDMALALALM